MNDKAASAQQKAFQERKRGQHDKAVKRLEQAIASHPDELELYLDATDACLESGQVTRAVQFLRTAQERFTGDRERITSFVRNKLEAVRDPALARFVVENAVKSRDLKAALEHLEQIPDHTVRDLLTRSRTKRQSLKAASHGGYSLESERVTNELMAALLAIRINNPRDGFSALVKIMDGRPAEQAVLTPFLVYLESKHPASGRLRFARAVAQCAAGSYLEAINGFVDAARMEPSVAASCLDRLKDLQETSNAAARVLRAIGEVNLIIGNLDEAATVLREYLGMEKEAGREVMMMVRPHADPANGINACTWLALDASLTLEQSNAALEMLRALHQRAGNTGKLLNWFETATRDAALTPDMRLFHATLALEHKQHDRGIEILRAVCESAPQEIAAAVATLDRYRGDNPAVEALYREYAAQDASDTGDAVDIKDEEDFQGFDNREFALDSGLSDEPVSAGDTGDKPLDFAARMRNKIPNKSFVDTREICFDDIDGKSSDGAREEETITTAGTTIAAAEILDLSDAPQMDDTPAPSPDPVEAGPDITESHVANVAQKLYEAGAAVFFHVDSGDATQTAPEPAAASDEPAGDDTVIAVVPEPEESTPPAEVPATFESLYQEFRNGSLDRPRVIELMEIATAEGRAGELGELLAFQPEGREEIFACRCFEAEHLLMKNRPLPAIKILAALDAPWLSSDQKRRVWFKIAICQRAVRDFAGAHETLTRLIDAFPNQEEFARLARTNFQQHLAEQSRLATALEKTSTLD